MDVLSQHDFSDAEREDISEGREEPAASRCCLALDGSFEEEEKLGMYILPLRKDGRSLKLCA